MRHLCRLRPFVLCAAVVAAAMLLPDSAFAQQTGEETGSWLMYFGQNRVGDRSSVHTEAQFRFWEVADNRSQLLFRVGFNHDLDADNMVTAGYAYIDSRAFDGTAPGATEHRVWQQYIQRARLGTVQFEHRFRFEQRWISRADGGDADFGLRGRYRLMLTVPLGDTDWFLSAYDEIFLRIENRPFDQNRLYGALGYRLDARTSLQAGYLLQSFNERTFGALQLAVFFNPDLR